MGGEREGERETWGEEWDGVGKGRKGRGKEGRGGLGGTPLVLAYTPI